MVRIVLPIENKVRELAGKLWLAIVFARDGHEVVFGPASPINLSLDMLKPDIYFALSAMNSDRRRNQLRALKRCGTTIALLDTEGSAFTSPQEFQVRIHQNIMPLVDYYFAWGDAAVEIIEKYDRYPAGEIAVTGNPRFDLVQEDLRSVYERDAEEVKEEFGDYLLFNTNFAVNHMEEEALKKLSTGEKQAAIQVQVKVIGEMISVIGEVASVFPSRRIIIRPHPSEDIDLYRRLFMPYENVVTHRKGDVRPWIIGSDAVVHNSCTTGISSALLGKPVFAYTPDDLSYHPSPVPNIVSKITKTKDDLVGELHDIKRNNKYQMNPDQIDKLRHHICNVDFRSAERISSVLDDVRAARGDRFNSVFNPSIDQLMKRQVLRHFGSTPLDHYYTLQGRKRYGYKISPIHIEELRILTEQFPDSEVSNGLQISRVKSVRDTYLIKTE